METVMSRWMSLVLSPSVRYRARLAALAVCSLSAMAPRRQAAVFVAVTMDSGLRPRWLAVRRSMSVRKACWRPSRAVARMVKGMKAVVKRESCSGGGHLAPLLRTSPIRLLLFRLCGH